MVARQPPDGRKMHRNTIRPDASEIRKLRYQRGWTQEECAAECGVPKKTLENVEAGRRITIKTLSTIAQAFDVNPADLILLDETASSPVIQVPAPSDPEAEQQQLTAYLEALLGELIHPHMFMLKQHKGWHETGLHISRTLQEWPPRHEAVEGDQVPSQQHGPPLDPSFAQTTAVHREQEQLLHELRQPTNRSRICIVGSAGSGKSTLLEHIAWQLAKEYLANPQRQPRRIPVWIDLNDWSGEESLDTFISQCVKDEGLKDTELFWRLCQNGEAVLLFDGFDEIRDADARKRLTKKLNRKLEQEPLRRCPMVLAGRPWAIEEEDLRAFRTKALELNEFTPGEIERFVQHYFADDSGSASRLVRQLRDAPSQTKHLVRTPLMLTLLCFSRPKHLERLPITEGALIEQALRELLKRRRAQLEKEFGEKHQLSDVAVLRLLSLLAWKIWDSGSMDALPEKQALEAIVGAIEDDTILKHELEGWKPSLILQSVARHSGILTMTGSRVYRITEYAFLEYLAGFWLANLEKKELVEHFRSHAWDSAWHRVFVFMAGSLSRGHQDQRAQLRRLVRWLLAEHRSGYDDRWGTLICLAASLLAVRDQLRSDEIRLARNVTRRVLSARRRRRSDRIPWQKATADILASLGALVGEDEAVKPLTKEVKESTEILKAGDAVMSLGRLGSMAAEDALRDLVLDSRIDEATASSVTERAPNSTEGEVALVVIMVDDALMEFHGIRTMAMEGLAQIGSHTAIKTLRAFATDRSRNIFSRILAAKYLGIAGIPDSEQILIDVLTQQYAPLRCHAACALGRVGTTKAEQALIRILLDRMEERRVRKASAEALASIESSNSVEALTSVAQNPDEDVGIRCTVIQSLGAYRSCRAKEALTSLLLSTQGPLRTEVVFALSDSDPQAMKDELKVLLQDKCNPTDTRIRGAQTLSRTGGAMLQEMFIPILNDRTEDEGLRATIADCLGKNGDLHVQNVLFRILQDPTESRCVRAYSATALGVIGGYRAEGILLDMFADRKRHKQLESDILRGLTRIGTMKALRVLAQTHKWSRVYDACQANQIAFLRGPRFIKRTNLQLHRVCYPGREREASGSGLRTPRGKKRDR